MYNIKVNKRIMVIWDVRNCSLSTTVSKEPAASIRVDSQDKGSRLHHNGGTYHHNAKQISEECTLILIT
jgi:hypothetical protein